MVAPLLLHDLSIPGHEFEFDGTIAVDRYDLMYHDANDVKPASSQADAGTELGNQEDFVPRFAGIANFAKLSSDTVLESGIRVLNDVIAVFDCVSATFEVKSLVTIKEAPGGTALENQKLVKTTDESLAIGYCTKREANAVTRVQVRLTSRVITPTAVPSGGLVIDDGGTVTQITSVTTAVVINTLTGQITTFALTSATGVDHTFTVTNSKVKPTDIIIVHASIYGGTADGIPIVNVAEVAAGSFILNVRNTGAVSLDALMVINFAVIRGNDT